MDKTRTRFAPSPTGSLHIGGLRTALFSYALAKHSKGDFILRIEDTDKKREVKGALDTIKETLTRFFLIWDEFYVQSQRLEIYQRAAQKLVDDGHGFYCQCEPKNAKNTDSWESLRDPCRDKGYKSGAVKLKVPENQTVSFEDFVLRKKVSWNTNEVGDATLLKSDGFPTYHLASVVDDHDMKISHVLRGHDWLPSTPIHLLVYRYLDYDMPEIGHLTDILDPQGGKLSKRKGSVSASDMLSDGYLIEAILNFIMLLGWAPKDNREIYSLEEFVKAFDPAGLQKANPVFDRKKLDWFNGYYIRQKTDDELAQLLEPFLPEKKKPELVSKIIPLIKERINKLSDFDSLAGFFFEQKPLDKSLLGKKSVQHLKKAAEAIEKITEFNLQNLNEKLMQTVKDNDFKTSDFFMDLRIAISSSKFTPPINESMIILGKGESLKRINSAI